MKDSPKLKLSKNAAHGKRFAIIVSSYHDTLTTKLHEGAVDTLKNYGATIDDISTYWVPGAFEIPAVARQIVQHQNVDAVICLGIILKGETTHNEYIAREVARGIAQIHAVSGIPAIFGVLTPETLEQAKARSGGSKENKGVESAEAAIAMVELLSEIKQGTKKQNKSVGF
jgi:6,7-dimethyl-8-ribityllumazine synthase